VFSLFRQLPDNKESSVNQVKQMVEAGVSVPTAIKEAIGTSVTSWADKHELSRTLASEMINLVRLPDTLMCAALAADFGGEPYDWAVFMWEAARPSAERFLPQVAA
jgi:hypothetical protein